MQLSQRAFAQLMEVSLRTVQAWDSGSREPKGVARIRLCIALARPELLRDEWDNKMRLALEWFTDRANSSSLAVAIKCSSCGAHMTRDLRVLEDDQPSRPIDPDTADSYYCPNAENTFWCHPRLGMSAEKCSLNAAVDSEEHLADSADLLVAEQRLVEIRAGRSESIPSEELVKKYGVDWPQ